MSKTVKTVTDETAAEGVESTLAPAPKKEPEPKSAGFSCYIGPTIPGVIQSGQVFSAPRAKTLKDISSIIKAHPLVADLVVDGLTLPVDRIKVKTPGNHLFVAYRKLATGENK